GIDLTDVDPADNGDFAVNDQNLAVIPVGQPPLTSGLQGIKRVEADDLNAAVLQTLEKSIGGQHAAEAVVNDVDLDPCPLLLQQQISKFTAGFIIFNDVAF